MIRLESRLRQEKKPIGYLLLMLDEADAFLESAQGINYEPIDALKRLKEQMNGKFKFVLAGLHNVVRFNRQEATSQNRAFPQLSSLTVTPFQAREARELLEMPLFYLGFRFENDQATERLISSIFAETNYFPGLLQYYCACLVDAMASDYGGYDENVTPPYVVSEELVKKMLSRQSMQSQIKEKFMITLHASKDNYYYILALLLAARYQSDKGTSATPAQLKEEAAEFETRLILDLSVEQVEALLEEMCELNVLVRDAQNGYRFSRMNFLRMMGNMELIQNELAEFMG